MYLPYLYQRPVLSSGRKLTKELCMLFSTTHYSGDWMKEDTAEEQGNKGLDSSATEPTV